MPRSTRQEVIRKHDQIIAWLQKAILTTNDLANQFQEHHPDYSVGYTNITMGLYQMLEFIKTMKDHI